MPNTIIVGAQWGDEGKGKIIDVLTEGVDLVVRSQGGNNAGHTVIVGGDKYILHLIPSGILHPGKLCVLSHGVVLDPTGLAKEILGLRQRGIPVGPENLRVSDSAHLVLPYHRLLDEFNEDARGDDKIGTTKRGIGPAYSDKATRVGIRTGDLRHPELLREKLSARLSLLRQTLPVHLHTDPRMDHEAVLAEVLAAAEHILPLLDGTVALLHRHLATGASLLFEGAQGTFLDLDCGTYPFVTSSNTISSGACTGSGVPPTLIDSVYGVVKAYTTRVGGGPFPTEDDFLSDRLHAMGREYGATTGRARRCGWFDAVAGRYASLVNGLDRIAVTNLDGLDGVPTLKICTAYDFHGQTLDLPPTDAADLAHCHPVYEELPGWSEPIHTVTTYAELPQNARNYLERLSHLLNAKLHLVSVGPDRAQTMQAVG